MEKTYKPLLFETLLAAANLEKQRFIGFDGNYCTQGAKALGVSDVEVDANQFVPVVLLGILLVKTGGAITKGSKVASDANGYAVAFTAGESNGYALDTAITSGEIIRIVRGI
jgi:hypothetical protein